MSILKINETREQDVASAGVEGNFFSRLFRRSIRQAPPQSASLQSAKPTKFFDPRKTFSAKEYDFLINHTAFHTLTLEELRERYMDMSASLGVQEKDSFAIIEKLLPFIEGLVQRAEELGGQERESLEAMQLTLQGRSNALKDSESTIVKELNAELLGKIDRLSKVLA